MSKKRNSKKAGRKPKSRDNAEIRALAQAKVLLIKGSKRPYLIYSVRDILGSVNYAPFLSWLRERPSLLARTLAAPFPKTIQDLRPLVSSEHLSFENELIWCYYSIEPHVSKLSCFNRLREEIDDVFIRGGDGCLKLLENLEETYGTSIWLLKKKVAFLQYFEGLERQKIFVETIKQQSDSISGIVPYIIHFVSYRSEPSVSPITFKEDYEAVLCNLDLDKEVVAYLRHHILSVPPDTTDELAAILCIESAGTAIDAYEMFVATVQLAVASGQQTLYPLLASILKKLVDGMCDIRLSRLLFLIGEKVDENVLLPPMGCEELRILFRDHENASPLSFKSLSYSDAASASPLVTALSLAIANSCDDDPSVPVSFDIFSAIKSILFGSDEHSVSAAKLFRFAWAIDGSCAAHLIRLILDWSEGACLDARGRPEWFRNIVGLGRLFPFELWWIVDTPLRARYVNIFESECAMPQPWLLFENDSIPFSVTQFDTSESPISLWRTVYRFLRTGDWSPAFVAARELLKEGNAFLRRQAVRAIPFCLLSLGKTNECVSFLVELAIADRSLYPILPIREVFDSLTDEEKASMAGSLPFAVLTDLYVSLSVAALAYLRSYAAEDFLSANSLLRPSELRHHNALYDHALLSHFLRYVCVESVMDTWAIFSKSHEVANERAAVCQLLADLNPDSKEEYQAEIKGIMRRLTLSKRLREVERSKIYIDIGSVKTVARQILRESFVRYMAFVKTGLTKEERSVLKDTRMKVARGDVEALLSGALPRNEMTELFESIVVRLRDEFVSSSQHGLDGYLSVRVRHGTLSGQLRHPLEAENLVALWDSKSGKYKPNMYWPKALAITEANQNKLLQKALSDFTASFDALVEEIKSSWLQIKKAPNDKGLLDFTILRPVVDYLSTGIRDDMTFDAFLEYIFSYFFSNMLEPSLKRIRQDLQDIAKVRVNAMLLTLQETVEKAFDTNATWMLRSAIGRARTQIQNVLDRIIGWFSLSKAEMLSEPFSIDEAVNIGAASIQASCAEFKANVKMPEELETFLISGSLPSFVDLLFLVFENAVRHSQMSPHPIVDVTVSVSEDILCIQIENDLGVGVPRPDAIKKIEVIRQNLQSDVFFQSVTTEGGTGFYKMKKILLHDFCLSSDGRNPGLDFGVSRESRFFVYMTIPVRHVEAKEVEE